MGSFRQPLPLLFRLSPCRLSNQAPAFSILGTQSSAWHRISSPISSLRRKNIELQRQDQRRSFLTPPSPLNILSSPPLQHLTARRLLPYPSLAIYDIIADVPSYSSFLPYCISSSVTAWSAPDALQGRKWPQEAVLEVGWGVVRERFKSKIFCAPGKAVEAVWGEGKCKLGEKEIQHHLGISSSSQEQGRKERSEEKSDGEGILTHLWSRWTVNPVNRNGDKVVKDNQLANGSVNGNSATEVALELEFRFANPIYAAMSSAVVDGVADVMIEAFERRVQEQLGNQSSKAKKAATET